MGNQSSLLRRRDRRRTNSTTDSSRGKRIKIVVLGAGGVGKTTLFRRLLDQSPSEAPGPTTSTNIGAKLILLEGQAPVLVELWDVPDQVYAGQAIFATYLQALDGALLVYDVASTTSWRAVVEYYALLSAHAAARTENAQSPLAVAVVGNKIDALARGSTSEAMQLAHEWIEQQPTGTQIHHATVSASQQLHTLELLRTIVHATLHGQYPSLEVEDPPAGVPISNDSK